MLDDGSAMTLDDVKDIVRAYDEALYWSATLVPSAMLKVVAHAERAALTIS